MNYTVMSKGEAISFDDDRSPPQVREVFLSLTPRSDFVNSMQLQLRERGRLSEKQMAWARYLTLPHCRKCGRVTEIDDTGVCDGCVRKEKIDVREMDLPELPRLMHRAMENGIKHPVIRAHLPGCPEIRLSVFGPSSKYAGQVKILSGDKQTFLGRIELSGKALLRADQPDAFFAELILLANAPEDFARQYGQRTGSCCFCGRELTRNDSIECGYGPICAGHYGLPHPYNDAKKERAKRRAEAGL